MRGSARASAKNAKLTPSQLANVTETAIETETETEIATAIETVTEPFGPHPRCVWASCSPLEGFRSSVLLTSTPLITTPLGFRHIIASSLDHGPDHAQATRSALPVLTGLGDHAPHRRHLDETMTEKCGREIENETANETENVIATVATTVTGMVGDGVIVRRAPMLTLQGSETDLSATATGTENATNDAFEKTGTETTGTATTCARLARHLTSAIVADVHLLLDLGAATIDLP